MPSRKAVTFSGKASRAAAERRSAHSPSTARAAAWSRAASAASSWSVILTGERRARCRISSA